jgi:hypothetical protein
MKLVELKMQIQEAAEQKIKLAGVDIEIVKTELADKILTILIMKSQISANMFLFTIPVLKNKTICDFKQVYF